MTNHKLPGGLWPVMLTPFKADKSIDFQTLDVLTDFYLEHGAHGLFANCLSSEMYHLTEEERLDLVRAVLKRVNGRVPVVATGTFGGKIHQQAAFVQQMRDIGCDAVVVIGSQLVEQHKSDDVLRLNMQSLIELTDPVPLGLYECPEPYKRLLSPEFLHELANSGRFLYHKDTVCDLPLIEAKIKAVKGSNLAFFNANSATGLDSMRAGADGLSPISANFHPELYTYLCQYYTDPHKTEEIEYLNKMLILMDAVTRINYPMSAKVFLKMRGLAIEPVLRIPGNPLNYEEMEILKNMKKLYEEVKSHLGI